MEPALHTGSLIFIDIKKTSPSPGDIITIRLPTAGGNEMLITHRYIREKDGMLVTKGDANEAEDFTHVGRDAVAGTYIFQVPYAGYLIAGIKKCFRRIFLIFTAQKLSLH